MKKRSVIIFFILLFVFLFMFSCGKDVKKDKDTVSQKDENDIVEKKKTKGMSQTRM